MRRRGSLRRCGALGIGAVAFLLAGCSGPEPAASVPGPPAPTPGTANEAPSPAAPLATDAVPTEAAAPVVAATATPETAAVTPEPASATPAPAPPAAALAPGDVRAAVVWIENFAAKRGGSGFFLDDAGHILTSSLVVESAITVAVELADGTRAEARVAGTTPRGDLALLELLSPLPHRSLPLGDAATLASATEVTAASYPLGPRTFSLTSGIVAAAPASREDDSVPYLQIDVPLNPASCGGPLLDAGGRVVGVLWGKAAGGDRVNYATPINLAAALPLPEPGPWDDARFRQWRASGHPDDRIRAAVVRVENRATGDSASGFLATADGRVLTTETIVAGATSLDVVLPGGERIGAAVIAVSRESRLALLDTGQAGLPWIPLGDATRLAPGSVVLAAGHPLGQRVASVTRGVVSIAPLVLPGVPIALLQVDVPVNAGLAGGPLLEGGEAVGIIARGLEGAEGIGAAVPANYAGELPGLGAAALAGDAFARWTAHAGGYAGRDEMRATEGPIRALFKIEVPRAGATGSGFLVSADGYALTAAHVVGDASTVDVIPADGDREIASVVARDEGSDLALLKLDGRDDRTFLPLGDATTIQPSAAVTAMGYPLGADDPSLTRGIVSAVPVLDAGLAWPLIQVDAAVNPGSSGGALVDAEGRAVGVVSSKIRGGERVAFASPINGAASLPLPAAAELGTPAFQDWIARAQSASDGEVRMPSEPAGRPDRVEVAAYRTGGEGLLVTLLLLDTRGDAAVAETRVTVTLSWRTVDEQSFDCEVVRTVGVHDFVAIADLDGAPGLEVELSCPDLEPGAVASLELRASARGLRSCEVVRQPAD